MYIILHIVPWEYKRKKNPPIDCKVVHYTRWHIIIHIWSTTFIQWLHQLAAGTHLVWWSSTCSEIRQHYQYQHQHYHQHSYQHQLCVHRWTPSPWTRVGSWLEAWTNRWAPHISLCTHHHHHHHRHHHHHHHHHCFRGRRRHSRYRPLHHHRHHPVVFIIINHHFP